ncbi:MAG: PspC domain-containing protein [Archaeoglobus sp.]|nr:PspC domain-containing protein [Archaeoglobus sp.]
MTKIYRSKDDKVVFGVCGGLAKYFGVDSTILRLIFIIATLYHGSGILLYIILAIIMPEEKKAKVEVEAVKKAEKGEKEVSEVSEGAAESVESEPVESGIGRLEEKPREERRRLLALGLIVVGAYFLVKDLISIFISSSQILGIILLLLGVALILKKS